MAARRGTPFNRNRPRMGGNRLSPTRNVRARVISNETMIRHPEGHASVEASIRRVKSTKADLDKAKASKAKVEIYHHRADAQAASAGTWKTGTQWIGKSAAWIRKKTIRATHPIHSWRATRVDARKKALEERKLAKDTQRGKLVRAAKESKKFDIEDVRRKLPAIKATVDVELTAVLGMVTGKSKAEKQIRGFLTNAHINLPKIKNAQKMIEFDTVFQAAVMALRQKDTRALLALAKELETIST